MVTELGYSFFFAPPGGRALPLHAWFLSADAAGSLLQLGATVLTVPTIVYFAPPFEPHSNHNRAHYLGQAAGTGRPGRPLCILKGPLMRNGF